MGERASVDVTQPRFAIGEKMQRREKGDQHAEIKGVRVSTRKCGVNLRKHCTGKV